MTLLEEIQRLRETLRETKDTADENRSMIERHEEQVNGERGLGAAIRELSEEVRSLKRTLWMVGAGIVTAAVGFCFTVLTVFGT